MAKAEMFLARTGADVTGRCCERTQGAPRALVVGEFYAVGLRSTAWPVAAMSPLW